MSTARMKQNDWADEQWVRAKQKIEAAHVGASIAPPVETMQQFIQQAATTDGAHPTRPSHPERGLGAGAVPFGWHQKICRRYSCKQLMSYPRGWDWDVPSLQDFYTRVSVFVSSNV
jgi:hypothetical protein